MSSSPQHVVICYSREDTDFMERIRKNLRHVGLQVWTDEGLEPASNEWKAEVVKAVKGAGAVLVLMSPTANQSELIKRVVQLAQKHKIEILPLLIKGEVHQSLLPLLAKMEYIDLRDDYEGNIIQVIRLCYEFRQQDDARTTSELRQAMSPDTQSIPKLDTPNPAKPDVKVSVSQLKSMNEVRKNIAPQQTSNQTRILIGSILLVGGVFGAIFAGLYLMGISPFESGETTEEAIVAEASVEVTAEVTAEIIATDDVEITEEATAEATAETTAEVVDPTDVPTATDVPPTPTNTNVPPTATSIPPSSTPMPTLSPIPPTNTPQPSPTIVPPTATPAPLTSEESNLEILYNGDTLILHNTADSNINLAGLEFVLVGASDADSVIFTAEEWELSNNILQPERCTQVWRVEFVQLPATEPPADVCTARSAFRSTVHRFWIADGDKTMFEVRRGGRVVAQCNAAVLNNNAILTCYADV